MTDRSTKFSGRRPARRRFASFRAMVEVLDTRQLMAAGVTGVPMAISGNVDGPLRVQQYAMGPGGTIGLLNPLPLAPVGTPIPLVTLINNAAATLPASGYTGTVDWGDGSSTDSALFGTYTLPSYLVVPTNFLIVNGPEHTYTQPGTYTITIAVAGPGDTSPTVYTDTATISNAPALTGQLNPTSDTGASDSDNITANRTPNFTGTTQPGASVTLFATSSTSEQTLEVGAGVADAAGNWSITTVPLADGSYFFNAAATSTFGGTTRLPITSTNPFASSFLIIDTAGPTITRFQVTNARKGTFQVTFADPYGLLINPTTDPTNYVVNRPSPTPRKGQAFAVASLTVSDTTTNAYAPLTQPPRSRWWAG